MLKNVTLSINVQRFSHGLDHYRICLSSKELVRLHWLHLGDIGFRDTDVPWSSRMADYFFSCVASKRQIPTEGFPPFAWPFLPRKMSSAQNQIGQQGVVAAEKSISNSFIILQTSPLTCQLHKFESCIQSIAHNGVYPSSRWPAHAFWQAVEEVIETGWEENSHRCFSRGT